MFLLDKPFVSDFLIQTIRDNNYKIVSYAASRALVKDPDLNWISQQEATDIIKQNPLTPIYSNSENALSWIDQHLAENDLHHQIKAFKDKYQFRQLLQETFPDFYFEKISLADIQKVSAKNLSFPFVIKPSVGFFSIGVHVVNNANDWKKAKRSLNPENLESIFPESVLNTTEFIIEAYIDGEEYAVDYYHNSLGEVVVLNVMHHVFSSGTDTSDRVYSTSKEIIERHRTGIESFLNKLGERSHLRNFPAHAELRIDKSGNTIPIEINPLRFGGWCTTGDLLGVSLGFNAYQAFIEGKKPDWDKVFKGKEDKIFSIVVLDNNSGFAAEQITNFDYNALSRDFEKPLAIRKFDIKKYPIFGFVFSETSLNNKSELTDILRSDLKKYIIVQ